MAASAVLLIAGGAWAMPGMVNEKAPSPAEKAAGLNEAMYINGKVVETMNAGGYTYMLLETEGKKSWIAVPACEVKVGEDVKVQPGMEMGSFSSKSLNRTFDNIVFSGGLIPSEEKLKADEAKKKAHESIKPAKVDLTTIKVEKAAGENAYTVAELYGKAADLNNKPVVLKGTVVKVSKSIMGKNWLHLRDGSGTADSNNMVVTSQDLAEVGETVTIQGTLHKDKDFGGGYFYKVIVEEAKVVR
jgi:hypothetical protein